MTSVCPKPVPALPASKDERSVQARFAVGAVWSMFGAVVSRGLTLAGFVLAGRLLGATRFGEVGMIQSTQGLFGVLAGGGLGLAATKYVAEYRAIDGAKAGRCFTLALLIAVVCGGLGSLLLCVFAGSMAESVLGAPHLIQELRAATGLLFFSAINGVQSGALVGLGEFRTLALLAILRGACLLVTLLAGIWLAGVMGAVVGLVLTEVIAVAANHIALRHLLKPLRNGLQVGELFWQELPQVCQFGGLAVLGSIATTLALWAGNTMLVSQPEGYAALGIFNAAERWRQLLLFLPATVSPILLSLLSHLHGHDDRADYQQLFRTNLWVGAATVVPVVGVVALAPLAMSVFGAEYRQGATTLAILAASAVAVVFNNILGQVLVSKGAIWCRATLDLLLAGVLVLVAWPGVPLWRDQGLALAHLLAYGVTAVALLVPVTRYLRQATGAPAPGQD
jgi:O-antigen/teichoic acid export membrane protein